MKQYLKPSVLILSCESLGAKMQGTGQVMLVCSGVGCGEQLGPSCVSGSPDHVEILLLEEGVTCPVAAAPSCVVTALSLNGYPVPSPSTNCWVDDFESCRTGCGVAIMCNSMAACSSGQSIEATVSCSGFGEPASCNLAGA